MDHESTQPPEPSPQPRAIHSLVDRHRWLPFVLPLAVFMLAGQLEPRPITVEVQVSATEVQRVANTSWLGLRYPVAYGLRIALTAAALILALPWYRRFRWSSLPLAVAVGLVGAVIWIGLCRLNLESYLPLGGLTATGARAAFNPTEYFGQNPTARIAFLAVRFFGLVCLVPIIEEFFLRGFFMRFFVDSRWWEVDVGRMTAVAVVVGTLYGVLSHPAELFAAAVWFSLITWLMVRSRSLWACVVAHAVTNLVLGIYVLASGDWHLW